MDNDIDEQFQAALDKLLAEYFARGLDREGAIVVLQDGLRDLWRGGERHGQVASSVGVRSSTSMPSVNRTHV